MCMEDIRLGRKLGFKEVEVATVASTTRLLISGNIKRTRLIVSPGGNFNLMIGSNDKQPTATAGIFLASQNQPIILKVEEFGKWLTGDIYVNDMGNAQTIRVIEEELDAE